MTLLVAPIYAVGYRNAGRDIPIHSCFVHTTPEQPRGIRGSGKHHHIHLTIHIKCSGEDNYAFGNTFYTSFITLVHIRPENVSSNCRHFRDNNSGFPTYVVWYNFPVWLIYARSHASRNNGMMCLCIPFYFFRECNFVTYNVDMFMWTCCHVKRYSDSTSPIPLQWRHNGRDGVSNHQPNDCLLNRLFRRRSKKTAKFRVTDLCAGNSPVTGEFPAKWPVTRKMFPFDAVIIHSVQLWRLQTLYPGNDANGAHVVVCCCGFGADQFDDHIITNPYQHSITNLINIKPCAYFTYIATYCRYTF